MILLKTKIITNIAEITSDNGDDIDSTPDNNKPEEDDQDYDNIIPAVYDLALQKFITKLGDKDITTRIPQVSTDDNGKIIYVHSKDPLTVVNKMINVSISLLVELNIKHLKLSVVVLVKAI